MRYTRDIIMPRSLKSLKKIEENRFFLRVIDLWRRMFLRGPSTNPSTQNTLQHAINQNPSNQCMEGNLRRKNQIQRKLKARTPIFQRMIALFIAPTIFGSYRGKIALSTAELGN